MDDAHLHTNNLKTAFNCYKKATVLESETLYSLTRQAFALTLLARYNEAILLFDKVIDQSLKYTLARKDFCFRIIHKFLFKSNLF